MAQREFADAKDLKQLQRVMKRIPAVARKEVSDVNREFAKRLAALIKPEIPTAGGYVEHKHGRSKAKKQKRAGSPRGAMRSGVRAFASVNQAGVRGGGTQRSKHFIVNELGGAVWWMNNATRGGTFNRDVDMSSGWTRRRWGHKGAAAQFSNSQRINRKTGASMGSSFGGHIIFVRERSPSNPVHGDGIAGERKFPAGWFFFKTAAKHVGHIAVDHADAMHQLNERLFGRVGHSKGR